MTEWTQGVIDHCRENLPFWHEGAIKREYLSALSEIERLQLLVGELVETLDGITKNWAFDEADLTALIKEAQEAIK